MQDNSQKALSIFVIVSIVILCPLVVYRFWETARLASIMAGVMLLTIVPIAIYAGWYQNKK